MMICLPLPVYEERGMNQCFFSSVVNVVVVAYTSLRLNWSASRYHWYSRVFLLLPLW